MKEECLFCNIVSGKIPCKKVYEDDNVLAFHDIHPVAPIHVLIIPKIHIKDLNHIDENNIVAVTALMKSVKEVAKICEVDQEGYRLICNCGENGGQLVGHLHYHLLGGKKLGAKLVK